jgi:ATP-binding cassette, subfamily B, bacterial HlyB/CyaB
MVRMQAVAVLGVGALEVMAGSLSVGTLIAFNLLSGRITTPLQRVLAASRQLGEARAGWQRLRPWLVAPLLRPAAPGSEGRSAVQGLRLRAVACAWPGVQAPLLQGVDLDIARGEWVALSGAAGTGKSCLARLLAGLDAPVAGWIELRGYAAGAPAPRGQVMLVADPVPLFSTTLLENLRLFDEQKDLARVVAAARATGLDNWAGRLPQGYATLLGRAGVEPSGGELALLGLTRAWLLRPPMLVVDLAALAPGQPATTAIWTRLAATAGDMTLVLVTDRPEQLPRCAQVWSCEGGRVVARALPGRTLAPRAHGGDGR